MGARVRALVAVIATAGIVMAQARAARASAQPVCSALRIVRDGALKLIESPTNGGYTSFESDGGVTYGVDPNSVPEEITTVLKANGPPVRVRVAGRTCDDRIFYIERVLAPVPSPLRPYTP
jgi:hypothetical protein